MHGNDPCLTGERDDDVAGEMMRPIRRRSLKAQSGLVGPQGLFEDKTDLIFLDQRIEKHRSRAEGIEERPIHIDLRHVPALSESS
jgi:hypothetical protein